jgi:peptidoglycan/xylan/chitin deacetylase (PgdA/CDA1 family)
MYTKKILKNCINATGLFRHALSLVQPGVVVLRYHSVQEKPDTVLNSIGVGITHSSDLFIKQMELLAKDYTPVSLDDVLAYLRKDKTPPPRAVAITFDDGFVDNYEIAKPILDHYGIPATFYVTVSSLEAPHPPWYIRLRHAFFTTSLKTWVGRDTMREFSLTDAQARNYALVNACEECAKLAGRAQDEAVSVIEEKLAVSSFAPNPSLMLNWEQVKSIHGSGHLIGSHTMTHPNMAYVKDLNLLQTELSLSKQIIENYLGAPVSHFSYPSPMLEPHWSEQTIDACRRAGYLTATTCTSGKVRIGDNPLAIKRMWVPFNMQDFEWYLNCNLVGREL